MTQATKKLYTPEEYFRLEEKALDKSEYFQGEILEMAGTSVNHNRVVVNVLVLLNMGLKGTDFEVFGSDLRIHVKENGFYTYPDLSVICGELEFAEGRNDTITNPLVLVEVLSEATEVYDRTVKFGLYRGIPTFKDYILISSSKVYIEYFHRDENQKWNIKFYDSLEQSVKFEAIEFELPLAEIYRRVNFESVQV